MDTNTLKIIYDSLKTNIPTLQNFTIRSKSNNYLSTSNSTFTINFTITYGHNISILYMLQNNSNNSISSIIKSYNLNDPNSLDNITKDINNFTSNPTPSKFSL